MKIPIALLFAVCLTASGQAIRNLNGLGTNITLWATNNIKSLTIGTDGAIVDSVYDRISFARPVDSTNTDLEISSSHATLTDANGTWINQNGLFRFNNAESNQPSFGLALASRLRLTPVSPFKSEWILGWTSPDKTITRFPRIFRVDYNGVIDSECVGQSRFMSNDGSVQNGSIDASGNILWLRGTTLFTNLTVAGNMNGDSQILFRNLDAGANTKVGLQLTAGTAANLGTYLGMNSSTVGHQWLQGMIGTPYTYRWAYGTGNLLSGQLMSLTTGGNLSIGTTNSIAKLTIHSGTGASVFNDINIGGILGWANGEEHTINAIFTEAGSKLGSMMFTYDSSNSRASWSVGNLYNGGSQTAKLLTVVGTGNVGIGTTNPAARLAVNGSGLFTNGVASFSDVAAVTITATGWTNIWSTNNAIVHFDGTAMFFTNVLRGNTPWYTNTVAQTGAMTTTLQPGEAIRIAGTSVVGRAKPF